MISPNFSKAFELFKKLVEDLQEVERLNNFAENKYNRRATFSLSKAILMWMNGSPFIDVLKQANLEEGKLFTLIMRLFQLCDEIKNFYKMLNLEETAKYYEEAREILIRDILSCKSLYLQEVDFNI